MKILVLGASGMAGHIISLYLLERGYKVDTLSRSPFPYGNNITGDLLDPVLLKQVCSGHYDYIINAVGMLNSDCDAEPEKAIYINSYLPHYIVGQLKQTPTQLIHMSTDCVFSGMQAPYSEDSFPDGETRYDRTKALGEINDSNHLTFRNSIIGPDLKENGIGLFNWFMKQNGTINGYSSAIWNGVTTLTLAEAMEQAMKERLTGLYHLVPAASISKYELLQLFNRHFKNDSVTIRPVNTVKLNKTLLNHREDFSFIVPSYEDMIVQMKHWIMSHRHLYPHYNIL